MKESAVKPSEDEDRLLLVADVLFSYLHDVIYKPSKASLDIETLPHSFKEFGKGLQFLNHSMGEIRNLAKELSIGNLDCFIPSAGNEISSSLKSLHAALKHLTWQTQQVAKGNYNQRVNFMGDFSIAFNNMIEQLERRRIISLDEKTTLEMYVQLILENSPNPILLFNKEGKLLYVSNSYFEYYKITNRDDILGIQFHDLFASIVNENSLKEIELLYKDAIEKEHMFETEQEIHFGREESAGFFKIQVTPMLDREGIAAGIIVFFLNITESIKARIAAEHARELAEESTRAKSDFLARMSHEIRTPMNAILGNTEIALRENLPHSTVEHLHSIKHATTNLLSIINDIIDFSKIEAGKLEITPTEYAFSALINKIISVCKIRIQEAQLRFVANIDSNIPNNLFGDPVRIRQILHNLLSNAAKFTDNGFVALSINVESTKNDIVYLKIEVTDSGKGIKQENIEQLFNGFTRLDIVKNTSIEGSGLGLGITHRLVNAMNGSISVTSKYGKGSTFTVILPQKILASEKIANVLKPHEKNILVYEWREAFANSIARTLNNFNINYRLVSTAVDFLKQLESKKYSHIIITSALYKEAYNKIFQKKQDIKIAVIIEYNELLIDEDVAILNIPVFSIPIADFLNDNYDNISSIVRLKSSSQFICPDARIMVVDDIMTNLEVAEGLMQPYKPKITLCKSGMESIEEIQKAHYDLILMDHMMPEMDGIEAVSHIRKLGEQNPYYSNVPIVAFTANAVFNTADILEKNGFNDYLPKPIDLNNLNTILQKWIPKEKQLIAGSTSGTQKTILPGAAIERDDIKPKITIEGLNTEKGISMTGGDIKRYFKILSLFYKDSLQKVKEIRTCLETNDISLYVVHVHALKSAAAIIGADKLSETAKTLEIAGKTDNLTFIESHNDIFLEDLESLILSINTFLSKNTPQTQNNSFDKGLLKDRLSNLRTAINNLDPTEINNVVNTLQDFTQIETFGDSLNEIFKNILIGEYDQAIQLIDTLLEW
ncbi:MAG: response regulator [Treponema sp.]|jgi:signal transduction histidine kinase/CheY-like chemotaxis protein/HPt (histidine-containing phosphotransfer) domain-containing protein|nr:response regulator [Treponema sp.]